MHLELLRHKSGSARTDISAVFPRKCGGPRHNRPGWVPNAKASRTDWEENVKIGNLPREQLDAILADCERYELSCKGILDFDIEELELYIRAAVEDRDARIERRRKCCGLILELNRLIDPVEER